MAYNSGGLVEKASKSSHSQIINNVKIQELLKDCKFQKTSENIDLEEMNIIKLDEVMDNPIKKIMVVDGGYVAVPIKTEFPSSEIGFFQYAMDYFDMNSLENFNNKRFIGPKSISSFDDLDCHSFAIPLKNIARKGQDSLRNSIRTLLFEHFMNESSDNKNFLIETLEWFIFRDYNFSNKKDLYRLGSCPNPECEEKNIPLIHNQMDDYQFTCPNPNCKENIYLTDVFRLHELLGDTESEGITSLVNSILEQFLLIHYIKFILENAPHIFNECIFIKDGPLAFFSQSANMHKPMKDLVNFLIGNHDVFLVGIEKSGRFVDHANEISDKMGENSIMLLSNDYIYEYIVFGDNTTKPYGSNTYYANKLIFKASNKKIYVLSIPVFSENLNDPKKEKFVNLDVILDTLTKLKSDRYSDALLPIVLINSKVSLSDKPSSNILRKFALKSLDDCHNDTLNY